MKKIFIGTTMLAAVIAIGFAVSAYAWQPPTVSAPGGNVDAPLNTGPALQVKTGGLGTLDFIYGLFGPIAKFQKLRVSNTCDIMGLNCFQLGGADVFDAFYKNGNDPESGFAIRGNGQVVIKDGVVPLVPGKVLTLSNPSGGVLWKDVPTELPPAGTTGQVLTVADANGNLKWDTAATGLPTGINNHTLRYNSTTGLWEDSGLFQNTGNEYVFTQRPATATGPNNLVIDMLAGTGVGGRTALSANVSADNQSSGEYATFKTNAKGFGLWNWSGTDKVNLAAKDGFFESLETKGLVLQDWTTPTPPANLPGMVLTADAVGKATWQPSFSLPPGGNIGDVLTTTTNGINNITAWAPGLPAGTVNHTLRYNNTSQKWEDSGLLQNNTVEITTGKFTGTALNEGLKVKNDGVISGGTFNAAGNLTSGFGSSGTWGVFSAGKYNNSGEITNGFVVLNPPLVTANGIAGTKAMPLAVDVSALSGVAGTDAFYLTAAGATNFVAAPSVSTLTNTKNLKLWNWVENRFTNLNSGIITIKKDPRDATEAGLTVDLVNASTNTADAGSPGRDGIKVLVNDGNRDAGQPAYLSTNAKGFGLWSAIKANPSNTPGGYFGDLTAGDGRFNGVVNIVKQTMNGNNPGLTIDLANASTAADSAGRDGIAINVNNANKNANQPAYLSTNTSGFGLWTGLRNNFADFRAGESTFGNYSDQTSMRAIGMVQIEGGGPAFRKVLASSDTQGNARWGDVVTTTTPADTSLVRVISKDWGYEQYGTQNQNDTQIGWGLSGIDGKSLGKYRGQLANLWCESDEVMTGGGGDCQRIRAGDHGMINQPNGMGGWQVACGPGDVHIKAVCMKVDKVVSGVVTTVDVKGPPTWHLAPAQASDEHANACAIAFTGLVTPDGVTHHFGTNQVSYLQKSGAGRVGNYGNSGLPGIDWHAIDGSDPNNLSSTDLAQIAANVGKCAVHQINTSVYPNSPTGYGTAESLLSNVLTGWTGQPAWKGFVLGPTAPTAANGDVTGELWYTYLYY